MLIKDLIKLGLAAAFAIVPYNAAFADHHMMDKDDHDLNEEHYNPVQDDGQPPPINQPVEDAEFFKKM